MVDYEISRQCLNFSRQIFDIHPRSASRDLQTSAVLETLNDDTSGTCLILQ